MNEFDIKENVHTTNLETETEEKDPVFYTPKDIARIMGCSIPTANDIMHRPDFPLISVGRRLKVYKRAFEEWAMSKRA